MMDLQRLQAELLELKNIEKQHKQMNGKLFKEVDKLKKENEYLKRENEIIRDGNDYLGIYSKSLCSSLIFI